MAQLRRSQQGRYAEAVKLAEQATAIDPRADWVRAFLVASYLELEDVSAARDVVTEQPSVQPLQWLPICLFVGASERGADLRSHESRAHCAGAGLRKPTWFATRRWRPDVSTMLATRSCRYSTAWTNLSICPRL